ncbi:MAG: MG2 domain-containing protein [Planctomycetota bacterium]
MSLRSLVLAVTLAAAAFGMAAFHALSATTAPGDARAAAQAAMNKGNYKDAYEAYRKLALDAKDDPREVGEDLQKAIACLANLNRANEIDTFREDVIKTHESNWRLQFAAAQSFSQGDHSGFIVSGNFERGQHRGGGRWVNAFDRDRVRALQLMVAAMKQIRGEKDTSAAGNFHLRFADFVLQGRQAWEFQALSDLATLPDYEEGWWGRGGEGGAPVGPDGEPVYHRVPKSWEMAASDGERWRWLLLQAMEIDSGKTNTVRRRLADFLQGQFGVQTMAWYRRFLEDDAEGGPAASGPLAIHTLKDNETMAKLATGVRRFALPDEFNFIKIYQSIADEPKTGSGSEALETLAGIFENRRQYERAAEFWRRAIQEYGPGHEAYRQKRLEQIVRNWGIFEPGKVQPAGKGATANFRFRNGKKVSFEAFPIDVTAFLADIKAYIKSGGDNLDWGKIQPDNLGWRLVEKNEKKYLGERTAAWDLELKPRPMHFDRSITVSTPLQKPGAYLLTAKMEDGNTSRIIIWVDDTVIVKKPLDGKTWFYLADAVTGKPIPKANLEFFGYTTKWENRRNRVETTRFAEFSDSDGQCIPAPKDLQSGYQWLITATTGDGRFAHLGFTHIWYGRTHDAEYNQTKVFVITDRPVYRPDQTVKFKIWASQAQYDREGNSPWANTSVYVRINDPKGEKFLEKKLTTDAWGGVEGDVALPKGTTLGVYRVQLLRDLDHHLGGGSFRVEEYKKPEFEVKIDAPPDPVVLGERITATVAAKYYFGAPVAKGKIKYKVLRSEHEASWYPLGRWDWFYGKGYWWYAYDYLWYPGWKEWGTSRPRCWWWHWSPEPPEVVMEGEAVIAADGIFKIEIDSSIAKAIHGNADHRYDITAEVTDESRRTIVGTGSVIAARKPFKVYAWADRGHYRVGDTIRAEFSARTPDQKPVKGKGKLSLLRISYDKDGKPVEKIMQTWPLDTSDEGVSAQQIKASEPGQYRLSYRVTDAKDHAIEGGHVFCITGEGFDGAAFRFNDLELVNDKREYQPGEKVSLMINTNRTESTVALFVRPANGICLPPKILRLSGKSVLEEIEVVKKDMPNFFVEALTISDGRIHSETKEITVPPESRVLNVSVEPSAKEYKPGEKASVRVKLTDAAGKPFAGSTVMTIYDKAVEYISGGSNVPEIKAFFWKWRRHHSPVSECSLNEMFQNLLRTGEITLASLGVFGDLQEQIEQTGMAFGLGKAGGQGRNRLMEKGRAMVPSAPGAAMAAKAEMLDAVDGDMPMERAAKDKSAGEPMPDSAGPAASPAIRKNFADTAFWAGAITTDPDGFAEISLNMPENLTGWKVKTWAMGAGTRVGEGESEITTKKNLMLRLQAPRFFVEKDEVMLSANVHNYLKGGKSVRAVLEVEGGALEILGKSDQKISVDAGGEKRVDWRVKVLKEGTAVVRMKALTDEESDAMEVRFPSFVHGMMKQVAASASLRPDKDRVTVTFDVPKERRVNDTRLEVRFSPTLAGAMVDALPYMAEYPYGCTEQTLNRFLPSVITRKVLLDMGLDIAKIRENRNNLNAQEIGDPAGRAKQWKRFDRNPVFEETELADMVKQGVKALTDMQCSDGGWGWFSGYGEYSWPHTTATVVHGLQIAKKCDVAIVPGVLENGIAWLKRYQAEQVQYIKNYEAKREHVRSKEKADSLDALVYMVLGDADVLNTDMREYLWRDQTNLAVYAKAIFALALDRQKDTTRRDELLHTIEQYIQEDNENQTCWLKLPDAWWYWYGSEIEAHAYYLKLLARTDPKGERASRLVKYLLNNRKHATYWNSTRDTAVAIEAMADFLKASGEDKPDMTVEILVDGKKAKETAVTADNLFTCDNTLVLTGDAVDSGKHTIEFRRKGKGPLYINSYVSYFTLEDFIPKAGLEVKVNRKYFRLKKVEKSIKASGSRGQAVDQKVEKYEREELADLATLKSGDLAEIELTIDSKNDYEYLVFEDMKPAGFEPVEVRSGYNGNAMGAYVEFRDERVAFFTRALARGTHSLSYRMRAEIPGKFSALPTRGWAMYAPELKCNSDEIRLRVDD